ncbi:MAG: ClpXP protease specificity-enhancing factor [Dokdonella sp.]|uniref:ClpXP protease specificity-enhancing factor n=1 Tax=Dokdonella sp. TaxID=2291710 RepID=UPI0032664D40
MSPNAMTSNRPYLLRALYEWISDNDLTPHLLVDASGDGVRVPPGVAKDGRVVLNIASQAVTQFDIANDSVRFLARFGGVSQAIHVPMAAVLAVYAQENGQGMMFSAENAPTEPTPPPEETPKRPHLRVIK